MTEHWMTRSAKKFLDNLGEQVGVTSESSATSLRAESEVDDEELSSPEDAGARSSRAHNLISRLKRVKNRAKQKLRRAHVRLRRTHSSDELPQSSRNLDDTDLQSDDQSDLETESTKSEPPLVQTAESSIDLMSDRSEASSRDSVSTTEDSMMRQLEPRRQKRLKQFDDSDDESTEHLQSFTVTVRVFEARELHGNDLNPLLRIILDGKCRTNLSQRATNAPKWNEQMSYIVKKSFEQMMQTCLEFRMYTTRSLKSDTLIGQFKCDLGFIYKSKRHTLLSKWLVLRTKYATKNFNDNDRISSDEICGFLKVSINVRRSLDPKPMPSLFVRSKLDGDNDDDILFSGSLLHYTMLIKIYKLCQLADHLRVDKDKVSVLAVEVQVGKKTGITHAVPANSENLNFDEEISLPIVWPTVITHTRMRKKIKKRVLATSCLKLADICRSGDMKIDHGTEKGEESSGFLPIFGPSYLTFWATNGNAQSKLSGKDLQAIREGRQVGDCFVGRVLIELNCLEEECERVRREAILPMAIANTQHLLRASEYILLSTFFAANCIHPTLKSRNIRFTLSIGEFGNWVYEKVPKCTNRSLSVMPSFMEKNYYAMPWGNHKPMCEIPCAWENVNFRIGHSNILQKIAKKLFKSAELALMESNDFGAASSIIVDAIEQACESFGLLSDRIDRDWDSAVITPLDRYRRRMVVTAVIKIINEFANLKFERNSMPEIDEIGIDRMKEAAQVLMAVSTEPEMSNPNAVISMCDGDELLAYAHIPINEIFYHTDELYRGVNCGQMRYVILKWAYEKDRRQKVDQIPVILHLRSWFGHIEQRKNWDSTVEPGQVQYFVEVFENQRRQTGNRWLETTGTNGEPYPQSDETGVIRVTEEDVLLQNGWSFKGPWKVMFCHDMWVGPEAGHTQYEDEIYEVQSRNPVSWQSLCHTTSSGNVLEHVFELPPPKGWKWKNNWSVDLHSAGDADGWVYSVDGDFSNDSKLIDFSERSSHRFRRRRLKRIRVLGAGTKDLFENFDNLRKSIDPEYWEYARKFNEPVHVQKMSDDNFRRRRYVREMLLPKQIEHRKQLALHLSSNLTVSPRIYEVYQQVTRWQMRASILWARDLLPTGRKGARSFVRVAFMNRCQETAVVENTISPMWNETLIFKNMFICGDAECVRGNPPAVAVEVNSENMNMSETFLGRFITTPTVFSMATDRRTTPSWYSLEFHQGKVRGSLLALFELFLYQGEAVHLAPLKPPNKPTGNRYSVSLDVCPKFQRYTVQILCWGVRDLPRFRLTSVRNPFIVIRIADQISQSDVIEDAKRNPNFSRPLIIFNEVMLPTPFYFAPPLTFNLYDRRSFGREPHIGMCTVQNFDKYISAPIKTTSQYSCMSNWAVYDEIMNSEESLEKESIIFDLYTTRDLAIDWWSKYYYSVGEYDKAVDFEESGIEKLRVFACALEDITEYCGFNDFLDTFVFRKMAKESIDHPDSKILRGELKARIFIRKDEQKNSDQIAKIPFIEFPGVTKCTVRIYVIRAYDLVSRRKDGTCDPYIMVKCGPRKKASSRRDYLVANLSPIFGQMVEMEIDVPLEKNLVISVMDRHRLFADNEIGHTVIDLENRLLTEHRATVGLPLQYTVQGPLIWRDQLTPLQILKGYCNRMGYLAPELLLKERDVGITFAGVTVWMSEILELKPKQPDLLGRPLQQVALYILLKLNLVPEHIETRTLYNEISGDVECGKLEMFVDLFPHILGPIPPPLNITARCPMRHQLRVAVWSVRNVILAKKSMGKPAADIYLKVFINGSTKEEQTDVHYRSLDGYGSFNWRFVIDFDYDMWERKVIAYRKNKMFSKKSQSNVEPILFVQIWDNNKFRRDTYIGQLALNLLAFDEAQIDADQMQNVDYAKNQEHSCCVGGCLFCFQTRCCTRRRKRKVAKLPRAPPYVPGRVGQYSLFEQRTTYGWWPCITDSLPNEQKSDFVKKKKKNDDFKKAKLYVTGAVELEITLLTAAEASKDPIGKKRRKPNHSPYLPSPNRSRLDKWWCTSRARAGTKFCWQKCGKQFVCILLLSIMILIFLIAFIYKLPDLLERAIFG